MNVVVCMLCNGQEIIGELERESDTHLYLKKCYSYVTWVPREDALALIEQGKPTHEATRVALTTVSVLAEEGINLPISKAGVLYRYNPHSDATELYKQHRSDIIEVESMYVKA